MAEPLVLLPDSTGLTVCDLDLLHQELSVGKSLQEAVDVAGIDSVLSFNPKHGDLMAIVERVRKYNQTGNIDDFWKPAE